MQIELNKTIEKNITLLKYPSLCACPDLQKQIAITASILKTVWLSF